MSVKCHYHPDREATKKCEKCEKLICIECCKTFNVRHSSGDSSYSTRHDYCLPCYYDRELESSRAQASPRGNLICIGILSVGIIILLILDQTTGGHFDNLPFGMYTIMAIIFLSGMSMVMFFNACCFL